MTTDMLMFIVTGWVPGVGAAEQSFEQTAADVRFLVA
jgi:hypothetical protein